MKNTIITVNDLMQKDYTYTLTCKEGKQFSLDFKPDLSPKEMLELGVFGGVYMRDCKNEFPKSWFLKAKLSSGKRDKNINYFGVHASQPLSVWKKKWMDTRPGSKGVVSVVLQILSRKAKC